MAQAKSVLTNLNSGVVIDRSILVGLSSEGIYDTISHLLLAGKSFHVADSATAFFTSDQMLKLIKAKNPMYKLIAEHAGITISDEQVKAIQMAEDIQSQITSKLKPKYDFAPVPVGWSVESHLIFPGTSVRRVQIDQGYSIGLKQAEKLWKIASKRWMKMSELGYVYVEASGYSKRAQVADTLVSIGCQNIQRFELEQLAVFKGWDFPA